MNPVKNEDKLMKMIECENLYKQKQHLMLNKSASYTQNKLLRIEYLINRGIWYVKITI